MRTGFRSAGAPNLAQEFFAANPIQFPGMAVLAVRKYNDCCIGGRIDEELTGTGCHSTVMAAAAVVVQVNTEAPGGGAQRVIRRQRVLEFKHPSQRALLHHAAPILPLPVAQD